MSVKQNAVNVLITQFGMEGLIFFNELEKDVRLDEENCLVEINGTCKRFKGGSNEILRDESTRNT